MLFYEHVTESTTLAIEDEWGRQAAKELDLTNLIGKPLNPDVAHNLARLIDERAEDLRKAAKDKQPDRGGGISSG